MPTRGRPELQMSSQKDDAGRQQGRQRSRSQHPADGTAGQKRPRRNKSEPPVSGREENENTLIKLSACCRKHALFHNKEAQQQQADENHENMPPKCLEDLQILTSLLPRVEKKFSAKKRPKPEDVGHLCAFYRDVLKGGYCPYAPQLFRRQDKIDRPDGYKGECYFVVIYLFRINLVQLFVGFMTLLPNVSHKTSNLPPSLIC
jgi:hypothetical protein